ncbi:WD40-repeat-containing domain protein [Zopfochytrium polystomum]|nr:WD40-repeat-containing domain protein [Zopfochytrium polystomum]
MGRAGDDCRKLALVMPEKGMTGESRVIEYVSKPSESLLCPICHEVFASPVISRICNHSFCDHCIFRSLELEAACPLCRAWLKREDVHVNLALRSLTQELIAYCPNKAAGCTFVDKVDAVNRHADGGCEFHPDVCKHKDWGCSFRGSGVRVKEHVENCPFEVMKVYIKAQNEKLMEMKAMIAQQEDMITALQKTITQGKFSPRPGALDGSDAVDEAETEVVAWPTGDIECRRTISESRTGFTSVAVHGEIMFSGAYDGTVKVFNSETGRLIKSVKGHNLTVWAVAIHAESETLFSAGSDGAIKSWSINLASMMDLKASSDLHSRKVYSLVVNGDLLYSGSSDGNVKVWDIHTLQCLQTMEGHSDGINSLHLLNSTQLASASSDNTVMIWDLTTSAQLRTLNESSSEVLGLTSGSSLLFTSSYDANITVLDLNTYNRVRTLRGHNWEVWQVKYVDGVLFSGSHDHTIKRWDVRTFADTATLKGHKGFVHALAQGDRCLISGCADKTIKIWK